MLSSADNPTAEGKASSFLSYRASKVQVEFELIARRLRRNIVECVARDKHGPEGLRILRFLLDTGKMDEKQVSFICVVNSRNRIHLFVIIDFKGRYVGS
jgi:DNA-directed RNA polymerase III subunit RPC3